MHTRVRTHTRTHTYTHTHIHNATNNETIQQNNETMKTYNVWEIYLQRNLQCNGATYNEMTQLTMKRCNLQCKDATYNARMQLTMKKRCKLVTR
jgi:hypothetical protein